MFRESTSYPESLSQDMGEWLGSVLKGKRVEMKMLEGAGITCPGDRLSPPGGRALPKTHKREVL